MPPASPLPPIQLKQEVLPFGTQEFHIKGVVDERENKKAVAFLLPLAPAAGTTPQPVDLQNGSVAALETYIQQSLKQNQKLRPVVLRLKEFQLTEAPAEKGRVAGKAKIAVAFAVRREGKLLHLFDYAGSASYSRPTTGPLTMVEPLLRRMVAGSLRYLTTWVEQEAPHNEKLTHTIKVHFEDYLRHQDDDTLFYDPNRPLTWNDFQGGSRVSGSFAASIFPGLSNDIQATVQDGVVHVLVSTKPYILRNLSKILPSAKTAYSLNHEQRHFDIVKLVSEHYKQRLKPEKLTLEDYESQVKYQYLEALWEMDRLQKQYDGETGHGTNTSAQSRWDKKIDDELRALKVKL
ncbi:hypothetical protein GCM10011405_12560 [Rufibacter glacialis]|nr:hypothetical protein [Rufibacter glacialis]KAA6435737.1 hypothetical protein FOE74_07285 [Rufibacter glacialis]GGK66097.1 hypothetical protein GCM10011405_12560 [Rufibacter glacialis]